MLSEDVIGVASMASSLCSASFCTHGFCWCWSAVSLLLLEGDPGFGHQGFEGLLVVHPGDSLVDPLQVFPGAVAVAADVLHKGKHNDRALACVLAADEEPVLGTQFERTHGVLDLVVVDFQFAMLQVECVAVPEFECVVQGLAQRTAWQHRGQCSDGYHCFAQAAVDRTGMALTHFTAGCVVRWPLFVLAQARLNGVEFGDLLDHPRRVARLVLECIFELAPNMGKARHQLDAGLPGGKRWINRISVTLEVACKGPFRTIEQFFEAGSCPSLMPLVDQSVSGIVDHPKVAPLGFAVPGRKVVHRGFVALEVATGAQAFVEDFVEGLKQFCPESVPMAEHVAAHIQAVAALEFNLLAIEGLMQAVFLMLDVGQKRGTQHTALQEGFGLDRSDRRLKGMINALVDFEDQDPALVNRRGDLKAFAALFADFEVILRICPHFFGHDALFYHRELLHGFAQSAGARLARGPSWSRLRLVSLRGGEGVGGVGLFCRVAVQEQFKLVRADLLALGPVKLPNEIIDSLAQQVVFLTEVLIVFFKTSIRRLQSL